MSAADRHDKPYTARRDGETAGTPTLLDVVRGPGPGPRQAGQAQPGPSAERVLYVHPADVATLRRLIELRATYVALVGVRLVETALVGVGGIAATLAADVDRAAALMRDLAIARQADEAGGLLAP